MKTLAPITITTDGPPIIALIFPLEGAPQLVTSTSDEGTYIRILNHLDVTHHDFFRVYARSLELLLGDDVLDHTDLDLDDLRD